MKNDYKQLEWGVSTLINNQRLNAMRINDEYIRNISDNIAKGIIAYSKIVTPINIDDSEKLVGDLSFTAEGDRMYKFNFQFPANYCSIAGSSPPHHFSVRAHLYDSEGVTILNNDMWSIYITAGEYSTPVCGSVNFFQGHDILDGDYVIGYKIFGLGGEAAQYIIDCNDKAPISVSVEDVGKWREHVI